jgi:hypothetical protein
MVIVRFSRASLTRWGVRAIAVAMAIVAVVLVTTVPHQSGSGCILSPWSHWRGVPSPFNVPFPRPASFQQHLVACMAVISDRWHVAWGLGIGAVLLLVGSLVPRRVFAWSHRKVHRPSTV